MSEKFRKIVNAPHWAFGRARKMLKAQKPTTTTGKIARGAGIGLSGMMQFLMWATKYFALDNHATRVMERGFANMTVGKNKTGQDKKLSSFAKKYPNLSSHLLYYTMLAMVAGGVKGYDALNEEKGRDDTVNNPVVELTLDAPDNELKVEPNTYGAYLAQIQPIVPYLIADLIAKEGVHVDPKTGLHTPYLDSKKIPTIGFGSTVLMDGSKVTMNTAPITTEQAFELARWHLSEETFFIMYCYDTANQNINIDTTNEALSIGSVFYNSASKLIEDKNDKNHKERFTLLRQDFKNYGFALPDSIVQARFDSIPIVKPESFGKKWLDGKSKKVLADELGNWLAGGRGLQWRRWIEAGLLTGDISPEMLLDCPVNGIYSFYEVMGRKKDKFFTGRAPNRQVNRATYADFKSWLENPVDKHGYSLKGWKKVSDFLPPDVLMACRDGKCKLGNSDVIHVIPQPPKQLAIDMYTADYETQYKDASALFRHGDFVAAASAFENILVAHPDNALVHNDLAATYNKLGRYDDAIAHVREIINRIGDKKQYAAAYYNAGVAYEKKGNFQRALANYKFAVANGNKRVQRDVTRMSNKVQSGGGATKKSNTTKKSNRKTAFNSASHQVKKNAFMKGLAAFNSNNNNMA